MGAVISQLEKKYVKVYQLRSIPIALTLMNS